MKKRMAKLISYKRKDENRYSTFNNVSFATSNDNLAFKTMPKPNKKSVSVSPAVHKPSEKRSQNKKPRKRKRWISWTCCYDRRKWIKRILCCPCLYCFYVCCKRRERGNLNNDDDIDKAVVEYRQRQGISGSEQGSQKSTLKSEKGAGRFWSWDESWKSNSDKFLESLEFDCIGSDKSWKRKLRQKNSKVRDTAFNKFCGGGWRLIYDVPAWRF